MQTTDAFLRRHGFQIAKRPRSGEAWWSRWTGTYPDRKHVIVPESKAIDLATDDAMAKGKAARVK